MKNTILKLITLVAVVIASTCAYLYFFASKPDPVAIVKPADAIINDAKIKAEVIAKTVDEKGFSQAVLKRKAEIIGNGDISKLPVSQSVIDSLRLDNLDKSKKLQEASVINARLVAKDLRAEKLLDSLKNVYYEYKDDIASVSFRPDSISGKFDLGWKINLIRHDYKKGRTLYTDILSPDKRITIDGMSNLTFRSDRPPRFGIGLQAGYYYDHTLREFKPAIGVGISYNIIKF